MLQSQQNMAIWVSNELSHSVQRANRLEDKNCITFFTKTEKLFFFQFAFIFFPQSLCI